MAYFVQVVDGQVKQVWDTAPPDGVGNNGWKNAVETKPEKDHLTHQYGQHYFDLKTDPVQIIWPVIPFTAEEVAANKANALKQANKVIQDQLDAIDVKKVRALTDALLSGGTARLEALEAEAAGLRAQLQK
jgi:mevalonate kinase